MPPSQELLAQNPAFSLSPLAGEGLGRDPCGAVGATDSRPGTRQLGARAWLPSPLAGEGLGERGMSAKASAFPPLPNPSPARGEGLKSTLSGCGSWVGGNADVSALAPLSPDPSPARGEGSEAHSQGYPVAGPTRRGVHGALLAGTAAALLGGAPPIAFASGDADVEKDAARALGTLYRQNPTAAAIGKQAKAILVFPKIVKAGLVLGGSYGEGVLMQGGRVTAHYNSVSASWGWQAGAQTYSYVLFLKSEAALRHMDEAKGWELGVGPTVAVVNEGVARNLSTQTLKDDVYAFFSDQQGLMAGVSLEGTKVTRLKR